MGASLSQPTQHLPGDVLANIKRSKDRDYRFRMALSCHQRFYKHFDPAKLVLNRTEFCAVFAPAYGDPALHFAHLDAHGRGRVSSFEEDDASNAGPNPALFKDWQQADLAPEVRAVDDECFAEVSGLRSLSTSLSDLAGGLEELKASMSSFWADKHAKLDEAELGRASAALVVQKHYRRHVVRRRFAQWVDLEDDEDLTSQLEGVRVAVAQFCLANHVDFDRIETKFSTIQDNLDGANRDSVDADRLLGWNPDVPLANLAGSRATACRIREWQSQHRPATREAETAPGAGL